MANFDELFGEKIKEKGLELKVSREETEDQFEIKKIDRILTFGLLIILLIVPLITRLHITEFISPLVTGTSLDSGVKTDIYTFYKFVALIIGTILLSIVFIYKVYAVGYVIPKSIVNVLTGVLLITILLSAVFSPTKSVALIGAYNRYEGTLTYLCYIILFFIAYNIKYSNKQLQWFIYILYTFVVINVLLGLLNFYGIDVLKNDFVYGLLFSGLPEGATLHDASKFVATLNHGNYVSGFAAVLIGLFLTWSLLDKNNIRSIMNLIFALLSVAMLFYALSSSGFVTSLIIIPLAFLLIFIAANKKKFIIIGVSFLILSSGIFVLMSSHNSKVWDETLGMFLTENPFKEASESAGFNPLLASKAFAEEKVEFSFPQLPESGVGPGSGRLYIWGQAWQLIKDRPLVGYGLDTFTYQFPQNDTGKHSNIETYTVTVDKPHNLYVGMAYGSGVIAMLAMVALFGHILFHGGRTALKEKDPILIALLLGALAYMGQAMFNDSIGGVGVVFWVLIGVITARIIQKEIGESLE